MGKKRKQPDAEWVAQLFHEAYVRLSSSFGIQTWNDLNLWSNVPEKERQLMIAVSTEVLKEIGYTIEDQVFEPWPDNLPIDEQIDRLSQVLTKYYLHTFDRSEGAMEKAARLLWEAAHAPIAQRQRRET